MLESHRTTVAHIEFTSRCNLKCVFCSSSQPDYKGIDLDEETIESAIEALKKRKPKLVSVNGHGETTIYRNWHIYCNKMLDAGIKLHIISNFAKKFSPVELHTLSRFKSIEISCDTSDPVLLKKLRRGLDLETLSLNLSRLLEISLKERRRLPEISFSCVISDLNVFKLTDYVAFGKSLGVTHFNFCNLTKYPDLEDTLNANHISEMPVELLPEVKASLDKTFEFLHESHIAYHFQQGLLDSLNQKIREANSSPLPLPPPPPHPLPLQDSKEKEPVEENTGEMNKNINEPGPHRYSSSGKVGQTRSCLDPWEFILLQANKDVSPCCWHRPIHSLGKNQSLAESFNNTRMKDLRRRLLTGDLSENCLNCPARGWTTIDNLRHMVWSYLNPGIKKLLPFKMMKFKPDVLTPFEVHFAEGWYPLETDLNIVDPDCQSWRWMSKKAVCMLKNPHRKALLIIRGGVDKAIFPDQKVFIKFNGTLLDEFIPGSAKFFKEYNLRPEMMGEDDTLPLIIETDKVFVPAVLTPTANDNRELGLQVYHLFFGEAI